LSDRSCSPIGDKRNASKEKRIEKKVDKKSLRAAEPLLYALVFLKERREEFLFKLEEALKKSDNAVINKLQKFYKN